MDRVYRLPSVLLVALGFVQGQESADQLAKAAKAGNKAAFQKLQALARAGKADDENDLGDLYYRADGVPQDLGMAASWYRKAAEQGRPLAQFNIGQLYASGEGVPNDSAIGCSMV